MHQFISSPSKTIRILKEKGIRLHKSLGQNYLIDTNVANKIVNTSKVDPKDNILEIGSGIGSLTEVLLSNCNKVICVEIDKKISSVFKELFADDIGKKIILIEEDALKLDYSDVLPRYDINKVVSNLPYKIAAPITIKLLLESETVNDFYFTIQKDIADRMKASTSDKNYNAYSVKVRALSDIKIEFKISSSCFYPKPHVGSVFISMDRKLSKIGSYLKEKMEMIKFFSFIDNCFMHRRKKLISALKKYKITGVDKTDIVIKMLSGIGKDKNVRPEELDVQDFLSIYKGLALSKRHISDK